MHKLDLFSLGSGSSGNSFLIKYNEDIILIDAGFSCKNIVEKFEKLNLSITDIKAIVITHTHSDHIKGVGPLVRKFGMPVYISEKSFLNAKERFGKLSSVVYFTGNFKINEFFIEPLSSSHDSIENFNFIITVNGYKISYISDTGYVTPYLLFKVKDSDVLVIEANYDKMTLINNKTRPWIMKQRVLSRIGHLSNDDALSVVQSINCSKLSHLFLIHISSEHNDYSLVSDFFCDNVDNKINVIVCEQLLTKGISLVC